MEKRKLNFRSKSKWGNKKAFVGLLITILVLQIAVQITYQAAPLQAAQTESPQLTAYYAQIGKKLEYWANFYNIPPVVVKAIAWMESGWRQFQLDPNTYQPLTDKPIVSSSGGIGIMQVTSYSLSDTGEINRLKTDIDYNIQRGCQLLNDKWRYYPKIGNGDRNILENWYFAIWGYNNWASANNPNNLPSNVSSYQASIYALIGQKFNSAITFTSSVTKIPSNALPPVNPPGYQSLWSTPKDFHRGDLWQVNNATAPDYLTSLLSGGSMNQDASGDYWYDSGVKSYSYYALGFYVTAYNLASSKDDKDIAAQRILNAYTNLLAAAADILKTSSSTPDDVAKARKYYWSILQGPKINEDYYQQAAAGLKQTEPPVTDTAVPTYPGATAEEINQPVDGEIKDGDPNPPTTTDPGDPTQPVQPTINRLFGLRAEDTAIELAKKGWNTSDVVFLARSDRFPDALAGAPLAKRYNAPLLLTKPDTVDPAVIQEILRLDAKKVVILGGEGAVKPKVVEGLLEANPDLEIERIFGNTAPDTAAEIARKMGPNTQVILASANNFTDALSASAPAAAYGIPILLTNRDALPEQTAKVLEEFGVTKAIIVGGNAVISNAIEQNDLAKYNPERLAGRTKYDTMLKIVQYFKQDAQQIYIATGDNFPDGLAGGPLAALSGSPLLLVGRNSINNSTLNYLAECKSQNPQIYILGGSGAITPYVESLISAEVLP